MAEQNYSSADVAAVANIKPGTFDAWLNRGHLGVEPGPGQGRSRRYDLKTAVHISIIARLVEIGFTIRAASDAAENSLNMAKSGLVDFLVIAPRSELQEPVNQAVDCKDVSVLVESFFPLMFPDGPPDAVAILNLATLSARVERRLTERQERGANAE